MKLTLLKSVRYLLATLCFFIVFALAINVCIILLVYICPTPDVLTLQRGERGAVLGSATHITISNWLVWSSILWGLLAGSGAAILVLRPYLLKRVPRDVWWMMAPVAGLMVFGLWKALVPAPDPPRHAPPDMIGKFHYDTTGEDTTKGGYIQTIWLDEENKHDRLRIAQAVVKFRRANRSPNRAGEYIDVLFEDPDQNTAMDHSQPRHRITWTPRGGFANRY